MTNGKGEDSPGVAWLLGEDLTALSVLRDRHYPGVYGDPDKMSSANYHVASEHSGGVHINSGFNDGFSVEAGAMFSVVAIP